MKKLLNITIISIAMLCLIFSCTNDASENLENATPSIRGRIDLNDTTGISYEDISFTIEGKDGIHSVNPDGTWKVSGLEEGKAYTLYFKSTNQARGLDDIAEWGAKLKDVIAKSGQELIEYLASITRTWEVKGKVDLVGLNSDDALGFAGTSVFIPGTGYMAMTDKDGNYSIKGVPAGDDYTVIFQRNDYQSIESPEFNLPSRTTGQRIKNLESTILVKSHGYISGKVILEDYPEHSFVNDTVYASKDGKNSAIYPISKDGYYNIDNIKNGKYTLHFKILIDGQRYKTYEAEVNIIDGNSVRYDLIVETAKASIKGIIKDTDQKPIEGAKISLNDVSTTSGTDGSFTIVDIIPGEYNLFIEKEGYANKSVPVELKEGENKDLALINITPSNSQGYYKVRVMGDSLEIVGYYGTDKNLIIPSTFEGKSVTSIGEAAFKLNKNITSVTIPDTVTTIKTDAFNRCHNLQSIKLGSEVKEIGGWCFQDCTSLQSIEWNAKIETIGQQAFRNCKSLTKITMPDSVTTLEEAIFWDCHGLTEVKLSKNAKVIPSWLFDRCIKLSTITMAPDITSIGMNAFRDCPITGTFEIPATVTYVGSWAFEGTLLNTIIIHNTEDYVGNNWDYNWNNINAKITYETPEVIGEWKYIEKDGKFYITGYTGTNHDWIVPSELDNKHITGIYAEAFTRNPYVVNVTFSEGIESISWGVLEDCPKLLSMTFPSSLTYCDIPGRLSPKVTTITVSPDNPTYKSEDNCFIEKNSNTLLFGANNAIIPSYVENIGIYAFQNRKEMTDMIIPEGVKRIDNYAFEGCQNLKNVQLPTTLERIGKRVFENTKFTLDYPDEFYWTWDTSDGKNAKLVEYSGYEKTVDVPSAHAGLPVTELGFRCFNNTNVEKVTLPKSLKSIGEEAFVYCPDLREISLPAGLKYIHKKAFADCYKLHSILIPASTELDRNVFDGWQSNQLILIEDHEETVKSNWHMNWDAGSNASIIFGYGRTLTIYTTEQITAKWGPGLVVFPDFEKKTGIKLNVKSFMDSTSMLNTALNEGSQCKADILLGIEDSSDLDNPKNLILSTYNSPVLSDIPANLKIDETNKLLPYSYKVLSFIIDTKSNLTPPKSLEELTNPEWNGKVVLINPTYSTVGENLLKWTYASYGDKYVDWWKAMKANDCIIKASWNEAYNSFINNNIAPLCLSFTTTPAYHAEYDKSTRWQSVLFEEPHHCDVQYLGITGTCKNRKAAETFVDYILSDAQMTIAQSTTSYPANSKTIMPDSYNYAPIPTALSFTNRKISAEMLNSMKDTLQSQVSLDEKIFATDASWKPLQFIDENGLCTGFEVELVSLIGEKVNKPYIVKNTTWDSCFKGLISGKYDAIASGVEITEPRKEAVDFSTPIISVGQVLIVPADSSINTLNDIKGKTVGRQQGLEYKSVLESYTDKIVEYTDINVAIEDMLKGKISTVITDNLSASHIVLNNDKYTGMLKIAEESLTHQDVAIVVKKGNSKLLEEINMGIEMAMQDGSYQALKDKWHLL